MSFNSTVKQLEETKVCLERHPTAQHLILSYYDTCYSKIKNKNYSKKKGKRTFFDLKCDIYEGKDMTVREAIDYTKERGLWGYCAINKKNNERVIHYWVNEDIVELCDIGELLAHELAHVVGIKSESVAIKYAYVASVAIQFLMRDFVLKPQG